MKTKPKFHEARGTNKSLSQPFNLTLMLLQSSLGLRSRSLEAYQDASLSHPPQLKRDNIVCLRRNSKTAFKSLKHRCICSTRGIRKYSRIWVRPNKPEKTTCQQVLVTRAAEQQKEEQGHGIHDTIEGGPCNRAIHKNASHMYFSDSKVAYYLVAAGLARPTRTRAALEIRNSIGIYLEPLSNHESR